MVLSLRMKRLMLAVAVSIVVCGPCLAGTINSIDVQLGTWSSGTFTTAGLDWNTYGGGNWAVGATAPGYGNPLLDSFNSVSLPDGEYYLYMAQADNGAAPTPNAIQITLGYSAGGPNVEVFTSTGNPEYTAGPYTLVSGSGYTASLVTAPQSVDLEVGTGQTYHATSAPNWVVDIGPEPGSWVLLASGLAGLIFLSRRKLA